MANRTRMIAEGAASTVLFIILLLITFYIPLVSIISVFSLPIPIMYFTSRHGYRASLLVLGSSFILSVLVSQLVFASSMAGFLLVGLVMGEILKRKGTAISLLIGGTLSNIVVLLVTYGVVAVFFHLNPIKWMSDYMIKNIDLTVQMNPFIKDNPNAMNRVQMLKEVFKSLAQIAPAIIVMSSVLYTVIIQLLSGAVLKRLRASFPKWPPFREWHFPRQLVWYYLADLILVIFVGNKWGPTGTMAFLNVFYILEWIFVIQGLSFVYFFFHQKNQGLILPVIITIFSLLIPSVLYITGILGIIDLGFDFRSRIRSHK